MKVRTGWSYVSSFVLVSIALLTLLYILTGIDAFWDLSGILFWVSLSLLWPRSVKFEKSALILEWGWPKVVFRRKILLQDIREVINVSSAERLRLIRYMKDAYLWLVLWLSVGLIGILKNAPPGPYLWGNWIFWGIAGFIREAVPIGNRVRLFVSVLGTAFLVAAIVYPTSPDAAFYFVAIGVLMAFFFADEENRPSGVLLITDEGWYIVAPMGGEGRFLNQLAQVVNEKNPGGEGGGF
ncbi:hypothetical protein A3L11_04085 [Thermococcus siculi]|uniref:Uncharacterized protein n=1 Tax=Thermococcus siculi TaxID=72803 RepID=A0A2Z2MP82_9EURY|nr:hypothetical protein [Thermococcus siculi]ASJ08454.1 hypothetical protein A3L11_04085 [Thermococcus siculi]